MKLKRLLGLIIVLALALSFAAGCNGDSGNNNGGDEPAGREAGDRDLGGMAVTRGVFWAVDNSDPTTEYGLARQAYLNDMQTKYNFTYREEHTGGWSDQRDLAMQSILAGTPMASIIALDSGHTMALFKNDLFYPVSDLPSFDRYAEKWNQFVIESMTFNGKTYGFAHGYEPRSGVFFNKNVLLEAGIDPEKPYELQAANEWTWAAFEEMCLQVTRDVDGDGILDFFGVCAFDKDTLNAAILSNGAQYIGKGADGFFFNATNTPEFLEACDFIRDFAVKGFLQPKPDGTNWDWWKDGFREGKAAFIISEEYFKADLSGTTFDWGFVFFPRGPRASELVSIYRENINILPITFSEQEADDIMFAYDLATEPPPGFEADTDAWKYGLYGSYRDTRAVDDTLAMMRVGANGALRFDPYVQGLDTGDIGYSIWNLENTSIEVIESVQFVWDTLIEETNDMISKRR